MWIWIIVAAVLVIAAWLLVWLITLPMWIAIVVTAVAVFVTVVWLVVRFIRGRLRAVALERELLKQAGDQADRARPERRPEILALQTQMRQAIGALKKSRLGAGTGGSALYALPWYVIVGPPAAGKTTALEQSGLAFTSPGSSGSKIRGTAGTRNCDWWFSQHAILLDTAGRFATEEEDREEWFVFLDTVKRFRPGKPLDGILVAVSVEDLVGADESRVEELAQKLRARIDEMMGRLEMVLPIYLMLTKLDLVAGFIEFWGDTNKQQRGQAWGATFRLDDERLNEPGRAFEGEFDILLKSLHSRLLDWLPRERVADARTRILQFPAEFQLLKQPLARFIEELLAENPYQDAPILRGFYFTSGTQVGRPLDRVLANMVRGFNLRVGVAPEPGRHAQSQSYFVTELLKAIVFPDRHVSDQSGAHRRRQLVWQLIAGGFVATATSVLLAFAVVSYLDHSSIVQAFSKSVEELKRAESVGAARYDEPKLDALTGVLGDVQRLREEHDRIRLPGWLSSGPLYEPAYVFYLQRLRSIMEGPVRDHVTAELRSFSGPSQFNSDVFYTAYTNLKLFGMMTAPDHLDVDWAREPLKEEWARAGQAVPRLDPTKIDANTREYLDAMKVHRELAWQPDEIAIGKARKGICQQPVEDLQYATLLASAKTIAPIGWEKIFSGQAASYLVNAGQAEVPGAYTKAGWERIRLLLQKPELLFALEPWVCGTLARTDAEVKKASVERLRQLYFERFQNAWVVFFRALQVARASALRSMVDELRTLEQNDGPYVKLFRTLSENVTLDVDDSTLTDRVVAGAMRLVDAGAPADRTLSPVERYFRPLLSFGTSTPNGPPSELTNYLGLLQTLEGTLSNLSESTPEGLAQAGAEIKKTKNAMTRLFGRLELRSLIELNLMMPPVDGALETLHTVVGDQTSLDWDTQVWNEWNAKLANKYPFGESQDDAALVDFAAFFRPQSGTLWGYYNQRLNTLLQRTGNNFNPLPAGGVQFRSDFLQCLTVGAEITEAIFGTSPEPAANFFIKMQPAGSDIAEITLQVDGQIKVYRNEPEKWVPLVWPGKDGGARGGTLTVKGAAFQDTIPRAGDFGFFRLLDAGSIRPLAGTDGVSVLAATWPLSRPGQPPIVIRIRPSRAHPFSRHFFRRMKCPRSPLAAGAATDVVDTPPAPAPAPALAPAPAPATRTPRKGLGTR